MPENTGDNQPIEERARIKVAVVDVSSAIKSTAVDRAEEKLTAELGDLRGVKGFFQKVWKHNIAREYYRQREVGRQQARIIESGSLFEDEAGHRQAVGAVVDRFVSDYEETVHVEAGESKSGANEAVRTEVQRLVKEYAVGRLDDEGFEESRNRLFSMIRGVERGRENQGLMYADNMLEVARQMRSEVVAGRAIETLDSDLEVVVGRARLGVRTEAQLSTVDRITERVVNTKVGSLVGETTVASALSIVYTVGQRSIEGLARSAAARVGSFGATALVTGAVAGAKESYRLEEERKKHFRDVAKGRIFDEGGDRRRIEMETYRYDTVRANELTAGLLSGIDNVNGGTVDLDEVRSLVNMFSEVKARISLSDQRRIDLISYSDERRVESERMALDVARARAGLVLRQVLARDECQQLLNGASGDEFLESMVEAKRDFLVEGDGGIEKRNEMFAKMKRRRVGGAVVKGVASGILIGGVVQEVGAFFRADQQGLVETLVKGGGGTAARATPLEALRSYLSGDWKKAINFEERMLNGVKFKVPEGMQLVANQDGSFNLVGSGNQGVLNGLRFDGNGALTEESRLMIEVNGGVVNSEVFEVQRQVVSEAGRDVGVSEFVEERQDLFGRIRRTLWYDNDTPKPIFDKNELRLLWGGVNGSGVDASGNYVLDVSQMVEGGSFHGGLSADAMGLASDGKLFMALSLSQETQGQVVKVAIDASGRAVIDPNSEIGRMFFGIDGGSARFLGRFAEVVESLGSGEDGAEQVRVLATAVGRGVEGNLTITDRVVETITDRIIDTTVMVPASEQVFDTLVDVPPIIPIIWRTPLEKIRERVGTGGPEMADDRPGVEQEPLELIHPWEKEEEILFPWIEIGRESEDPFRDELEPEPKTEGQTRILPPWEVVDDEINKNTGRLLDPESVEQNFYGGWHAELDRRIDKRFEDVLPIEIRNDAGVELDAERVIGSYLERMEPDYRQRIEELASQVEPMSDENKLSICIPVAGHQEGKNIYEALKNYNYQTKNRDNFEIVLMVNAPKVDREGREVVMDETVSEIERFRRDYPEVNLRVMEVRLDLEDAKIGYIRKLLTDATLMRQGQRQSGAGDLILVSNDADNKGVSPRYIENFINKFETNPTVDGFLGQLDWDPVSYINYPVVHVGTRLFQYLETVSRKETGKVGSSGANFAFRSSIYAAVGGYLDLTVGEDVALGRSIVKARGDDRRRIGFAGPRVSRLYTSSRRSINAFKRGLSPVEQWDSSFSAFDDEVRKFEMGEISNIDYDDPNVVEKLRTDVEQTVNRTLDVYVEDGLNKDAPFYRRCVNLLGIDYALDENGDVKVTDISRLISGLRGYREYGENLRDLKSGKPVRNYENLEDAVRNKQGGVIVLSTEGGGGERYRVDKVHNGGQSYVARASLMAENDVSSSRVALRYGNGSAKIDAAYRSIYDNLSEEIKRCMPESFGVRLGSDRKEYVVHEWIDGKSLRDELEAGVVFSEGDIEVIFRKMSGLITELHSRHGYIHRDIKPDNILLERNDNGEVVRVVLTDWDLLTPVRNDKSEPEGTVGYAAPDQYKRNEELWPVIDEYALGMTLYELFTGEEVAGDTSIYGKVDMGKLLEGKNIPEVWWQMIMGLTSIKRESRWTARRALECLDESRVV